MRHSASHAKNPVISIMMKEPSAASLCAVMAAADTPAAPLSASAAAAPLTYTGNVASAIRKITSKLTFLRCSFLRMKESSSSPRPRMVPIVGK